MTTYTLSNARFLPTVIRDHLDEAEVLERGVQAALLAEVARGRDAAEQLATTAISTETRRAFEAMVRKGGRAKERLISSNLRLVASVARRQVRRSGWLTLDDLVQEGARGLSHAIDKFDATMGTALSTYATWWIRQYISRAIANSGLVRIPVHVQDTVVGRMKDCVRRFDRFESIEEMVAVQADLDEAEGQSDEAWDEVNTSPLAVDGEYERVDAEVVIRGLLIVLTEREAYVIRRRFGLDGQSLTLEEVGGKLGVTRERIRQIEKAAMDKLRLHMGTDVADFGSAA